MKKSKPKYIADSILNGIVIEDELIYALYKTKELMRLSRINHLGIVHFLYPMAKHYRLEHSLGVYEITRRMLKKLEPKVSKTTYRAVLAAALLHDVGHGPFSHLFESVSVKHHEEYSIDIISCKTTEIYQAFEKIEPKAREEVVQILQGKHPLKWCNQIISSEVDTDRIDYLLRDAMSTGAAYGKIDWYWLIKNARINEKTNELVFKSKALSVIESLILGRYHMNLAVYWNPKNVANTSLYKFWFNRMSYLYENNLLKNNYRYLSKIFAKQELTVEDFLKIDDSIVQSAIRYTLEDEDDPIIKKIADMFLRQEMPKRIFGEDKIKKFLKTADKKLENQTWEEVEINEHFEQYQKNHKFPSKIITNDNNIYVATEYSSVINARELKGESGTKKLIVFIDDYK